MNRTALTTLDDVKTYFSGEPWDGPGWHDGEFEGSSGSVDVTISPAGMNYWVEIEAVDDPTDSEKVSTEKPLAAIADFLGKDLPGGEHFERMSSSPASLSGLLRAAAAVIGSGSVSRRQAAAMLRRLSVLRRADSSGPSAPAGDMASLLKEAKRKGWDAELKREGDDEVLLIDVSGIYSAKVGIGDALYQYSFQVRGHSDVGEDGTTDDPIREYRRWRKSDDVSEAVRSNRMETKRRREQQDFEPTAKVKPGQKPNPFLEEPLS